MRVHSRFGLAFPEIVYKKSLIIEIEKARLLYKERSTYYHGQYNSKRRLGLIVEKKVLLACKPIKEVDKSDCN